MSLPSSESGTGVPAREAAKPICHWCFKPIEGTPVVLSYDIDLPQLRFHDSAEADNFHAAYFLLGDDNPWRKDHERRMAAYDKKAKAAAARELKKLARQGSGTKTRSRTA